MAVKKAATSKPKAKTAPKGTPPAKDLSMKESNKSKERGFPVVGMGSSAGGLEALENFFMDVSEKLGMAFVVLSHLDATI